MQKSSQLAHNGEHEATEIQSSPSSSSSTITTLNVPSFYRTRESVTPSIRYITVITHVRYASATSCTRQRCLGSRQPGAIPTRGERRQSLPPWPPFPPLDGEKRVHVRPGGCEVASTREGSRSSAKEASQVRYGTEASVVEGE